ncbi:MAG: type II secretion system protein [Candidatus Omnitrophica bacterium]|nr:type II secretion system protein [Candidatus Omnitrophota bacterium]MDD5737232.1 type II secretion system protein [Candidatus Omnitrophota bacterium]
MIKRRAFSLIEILLAITVIAVFFGLIFAFYKNAINKSKYVEAVATVANIAKTEEIAKLETGEYIAAANTQEVNERLGMDIEPRWFNYKVVGVTNDNFIVLAERIRDDIESGDLAGDDIVVARNNTGPISPDSVNQPPTDLGGDDIGGPDTGDSAPPGSSSPGSGGPSSGSPGGGSPGADSGDSGDSDDSSPTGGGSDDSIRYPTQTAAPSSLLDYLDDAPLAADRLDLINDNDIRMVYVNNADYGVSLSSGAFWWGKEDHYTYDYDGNQVFVTGNTIFINQNVLQMGFTEPALACLVAHEATHADYDYNPQEWIDATKAAHPELTDDDIHIDQYPGNSIDQEYNANAAMLQLWDVIGDGPNESLDLYNTEYAKGEASFKTWLRTFASYATLPDY